MAFTNTDFQHFSCLLLSWQASLERQNLPWKNTRDPYLIWLSEIILQQTRVAQGVPYFLKFKEAFPTITHLANANLDDIMRLWEGLGYYSRARNLHSTAKFIAYELNGIFPATYSEIRNLKGVGDYTAAAIASFAYQLPYPVVDGNVYRVLSRYFGIETPIDTTAGKKEFMALAQKTIAQQQPDNFNQAIMDFGAEMCKPAIPLCPQCPLKYNCVALRTDRVTILPIKSKFIVRKNRYFNYLVIKIDAENPNGHNNSGLLLRKRTERDIWEGLYDFPMIESMGNLLGQNEIEHWLAAQNMSEQGEAIVGEIPKIYKQQLTHQDIIARFFIISLKKIPLMLPLNAILVAPQDMANYACPKIINDFWADVVKIPSIAQEAQMTLNFL